MINKLGLIAVISLSAYLFGCATAEPIPMGNDTYMISQTSAGGMFKAMGSLKAEVMTRANEFAASKGKVAIPLASKESPGYPLHMPNFEYQFKLVNKDDPQASGGALIPRAPPARKYVQPAPAPRPKPRIAAPKPPQRIDPNKIVNASSGSGFAVSTAGHVITNNHVIKGCKTVKIHTKGKSIPAKVIAYDLKNDIALLKGEFKPSTFFRFSIDNAQLLQVIYVAGYPFGRDVSSSVKVTKGIVSALIGIKDNTNQIQIDAALQPGNSGGPIIDEAGNVIGIAVSKLSIERTLEDFGTIPENTNFGVKSDIAKLLLLKNNVNLITPNIKPITTAKLGHLISGATYYLSCWMTVAQIQKMRSQKVLFNNLD